MNIRLFNKSLNLVWKTIPSGTNLNIPINFLDNGNIELVIAKSQVKIGLVLENKTFYKLVKRQTLNDGNCLCEYKIDLLQNIVFSMNSKNSRMSFVRSHYYTSDLDNVGDDYFEQNLNSTGVFIPKDYQPQILDSEFINVDWGTSNVYYVFAVNANNENWGYEFGLDDSTSPPPNLFKNGGFYLIPLLRTSYNAPVENRFSGGRFYNYDTALKEIVNSPDAKHIGEFVGIYNGVYANEIKYNQQIWIKNQNTWRKYVGVVVEGMGVLGRAVANIHFEEPGVIDSINYNDAYVSVASEVNLLHKRLTMFRKYKIGENVFSKNQLMQYYGGVDNMFKNLIVGFNDGIVLSSNKANGSFSIKISGNYFILRDGFLNWYAQNQAALNAQRNSPINALVNGVVGSLYDTFKGTTVTEPQWFQGEEFYNSMFGDVWNKTWSWIKGKPSIQQTINNAKWSQTPTSTNSSESMWNIAQTDELNEYLFANYLDNGYINKLYYEIGFGGIVRKLPFTTATNSGIYTPARTWINPYSNQIRISYVQLDSPDEIMSQVDIWLSEEIANLNANVVVSNTDIANVVEELKRGIYVCS